MAIGCKSSNDGGISSTSTATATATKDGPPVGASASPSSASASAKLDASAGPGGKKGAMTPAAMLLDRPYRLRTPQAAMVTPGDAGPRPMSLVLLLHGFGSNAVQMERMSQLDSIADAKNYAIAAPDGTPDSGGRRFWNATESCCDFDEHKVDDVAYLTAVIDDATKKLGVDPKHVYIVGHSNGGFMALRLACDISPKIAAIVSLAGAGYADPKRCAPTTRVSLLDIHGDADRTIPYAGGLSPRLPDGAPFASAKDTVTAWGGYDGCTGALKVTGKLDLTDDVAAVETEKSVVQGCPTGTDVELWTVKGADHSYNLTVAGLNAVVAFLDANPKT